MRERWKALAKPDYRPAKGATITLGFDGARTFDATGIVATEVETGFQWVVGCWERDPLKKDWEVPQDEVDQAVAQAFEDYDIWKMYADPPYWETVVNDWAGKHGDKRVVFFFTRQFKKMADAIGGFVSAQVDGTLGHAGDERYDRHIGNSHRKYLQMRDAEGQPLWVLASLSPILQNTKMMGTIIVLRDLRERKALEHAVAEREVQLKSLEEQIEAFQLTKRIVGTSRLHRRSLELAHQAAASSASVLFEGESGTGKTTIARMIHQTGPRKDAPFVAVNCASLPRDLI
ncbi:hypothetical protein LCGC14_2375770, partial [marine sediment metagenome]